jgi:hypothetical protein
MMNNALFVSCQHQGMGNQIERMNHQTYQLKVKNNHKQECYSLYL